MTSFRAIMLFLVLGCSAHATITLPFEVRGNAGATKTYGFNIPSGAANVTSVYFYGYNISYTNKAQVSVNGGAFTNLNNTTTVSLEPYKSAGGIGGWEWVKFFYKVPSTAFTSGASNTISVRFADIDARRFSSGLYILDLRLYGGGTNVLPASEYTTFDVTSEAAPFTDSTNIATGESLFKTSVLTVPASRGGDTLAAKCADCHYNEGSDLKYFGYSVEAIVQRSEWHGLTTLQGQQIASFIRSRPITMSGRPWWPVAQPGAGLRAGPVTNWLAGAGDSAIFTNDVDVVRNLTNMTGLSWSQLIRTTNNLDVISANINLPHLSWNHMLPDRHPKDVWTNVFTTSAYAARYGSISNGLSVISNSTVSNAHERVRLDWRNEGQIFLGISGGPIISKPLHPWTFEFQRDFYAAWKWMIVKTLEIFQTRNILDYGNETYGSRANDWLISGGQPFSAAPHKLALEQNTGNPVGNGTRTNWTHFSAGWYHLQLAFDPSSHRPLGDNPIDWPYLYSFDRDTATPTVGAFGLTLIDLIVAMQQHSLRDPTFWQNGGWDPWTHVNPYLLNSEPNSPYMALQIPLDLKRDVLESVWTEYETKNMSYAITNYYRTQFPGDPDYVFASPTEKIPNPLNTMGARWIDRRVGAINNLRTNISQGLLFTVVSNSSLIWPGANWAPYFAYITNNPPPVSDGLVKVTDFRILSAEITTPTFP